MADHGPSGPADRSCYRTDGWRPVRRMLHRIPSRKMAPVDGYERIRQIAYDDRRRARRLRKSPLEVAKKRLAQLELDFDDG